MAENRVEFGIAELHIASYAFDGTDVTIGTPKALPGAVSFETDVSTTQVDFYADNIAYYSEISEGSTTATLEVAKFPDWFKKEYLGYRETTDGALAKPVRPRRNQFVLMFTGDGDATETRHIYFNCRPGPIERTHATNTESKTIETESVELTIIGTEDTGISHLAYLKENAAYDGLKTAIPVPAWPVEP